MLEPKAPIFHRQWFIGAYRQSQDIIVAEAHYVDSFLEMTARLEAGVKDLVARKVTLATHRDSSRVPPRFDPANLAEGLAWISRDVSQSLDCLQGMVCYTGVGKLVRKAVAPDPLGLKEDLILEAIRAVIQAETFIFIERGFKDAFDYEAYFNRTFAGSCRYYSNLDRVSRNFSQGLLVHSRGPNLFSRFRSTAVYRCQDKYQVVAQLSDSFHEMELNLLLNPNHLVVEEAHAFMLRFPDPVCQESEELVKAGLPGVGLRPENKKHIYAACGGGNGCTHLGDMAFDVARALKILGSW
ncbi:MAG: DUF2889 domain-containing protein [Clostridia bacterium]|nr:DUF2889 domain-containing protein [Clostridia bacterium]